MKRAAAGMCIFLILGLVLCFGGCSTIASANWNEKEPLAVTVTVGETEAENLASRLNWDGMAYQEGNPFVRLLNEKPKAKIVKGAIGDEVTVDFHGNPPDSIEIKDHLLNDSGEYMYDTEVAQVTEDYALKGGVCTFKIDKNTASMLSSYYIEDKKDIRGFLITAAWGKNTCEYAFLVQTDAFI